MDYPSLLLTRPPPKMTEQATGQKKGQQAEQLACRYLESQGLRLILRNYRCRLGELDLIMEDRKNLVFVEVRYRRPGPFGDAVESVTPTKQRRLIRAAQYYLQQTGESQSRPCRFDVVAIAPEQGTHTITWLQGAFRAD